MKTIITYFIAFLVVPFIVQAVGGEAVTNGELQRVEMVAHHYREGQARSWPTLGWGSAPMVVMFENGHIYAMGLKSGDSHWKTQVINGQEVKYSEKDYWGLEGLMMQPWFEIEGQAAFVYRMGKKDPVKDVTILAHERFHRHQAEHFKDEPPGMSRDHLNEDNLVWTEVEDRLMGDFLVAQDGQRLEILKDLMAVHQHRRGFVEEDTIDWENHQMRMEGLADYVSTYLFGGARQIADTYPEKEKNEEFIDAVIKWRYYKAGATFAYALDWLKVKNWKEQIEAGDNLSNVMSKALPLSKNEVQNRLEKIGARFEMKKRRKKVQERLHAYETDLNQMYKTYDNHHGVKLVLDHPRMGISGGGSNDRLYYLGDGSTVGLNDASVSTTRDGNWRFETRHVPHLFQHIDGFREVKLSKNVAIKLDNVDHTLDQIMNKKETYFTSIQLDDGVVSIQSSNHRGVVVWEKETLAIYYAPPEKI